MQLEMFHTTSISSKIVRRYLDSQAISSIYKTMFLPYFDFGDILFMKSHLYLTPTL